ncbi:WASH complex subunit 2A [Octodon degus]|uniref:WASH complex subunit 2A n=1 Tax=Octodon degus TaxID=10160 RepID=A0A6P6DW25_OCTDE|nr:WASH complex subunit 2A [Octodon degus]
MMNQATPDPERAPASEAVWERPWSVEEIRRSSQSWSLAADAGLLQFLQEFSQQTISRTHEIKKQVDGLIRETKATDCRLHNVFNDFLMLSNTQFIENVNFQIRDTNQRWFSSPDLYIDRPLPYLIGSKLFMEQEDVGLGELSSEEGSVGSGRGSIVDSEEEKEEEESDDEFANQSDNDQNKHITQISDEEEDDDADLFADSEKEEDIEDIEENTKPKRPTSFADELAARIRGDSSRLGEEQAGDAKPQRTMKEKKERRTPSDDEEDSLFAPPKLTDEDFSPFGSRGGLFSGGQGLFDDEDEESDLFRDPVRDQQMPTPVNEESSSSKPGKKIPAGGVSVFLVDTDMLGAPTTPVPKEPQKPEQPTPGKSSYVPAASGLFDDDDNDDFFTVSCNKPSKTEKIRSTASLFDDEEGDLFREKPAAMPEPTVKQKDENKAKAEQTVTLPSSKNLKLSPETKTHKSLFSDEEDSEDLFSSQNTSKSKSASLPPSKLATPVSLFDDEDEEDNLFAMAAGKKQMPSLQSQEKAKPLEQPKKKASALLFSSDEEDQWSVADAQTKLPPDSKPKGELSNSETAQGQQTTTMKKASLFEEDDEDDLFAIAKDSQKKTQRVSLLFEDDTDNGSSLFGSPPASVPPAAPKKDTAREALPLLFSDEEEKELQFATRPVGQKAESPIVPSMLQRTDGAQELEKEGLLTASAQEAIRHSDLFSPVSPLDKGTKGRTKTVLSLFDEEEDKMEDPDSSRVPQIEVGKGPDPDARPKSTGVFQDEELLFSHKLQKDNDPDVDLFAGTKKNRLAEPNMGNLFGDDEDDDLFSSAKTQPAVPEKKKVVKRDHIASSSKNQKHLESTQGSKEKSVWKPEAAQDSSGLAPFKTKEPSTRIGKIQANLAINPAALLPGGAPQVSGAKPISPELALPSVDLGWSPSVDGQPAPSDPGEASVSFDLPAQTDTLHSVNKSRVKVRGKRRPQTRAARRLAAQESSEAEDTGVPGGPITQLAGGAVKSSDCQLHHRVASREVGSEEAAAAAIPPRESHPAPMMDSNPFGMPLGQPAGEADLFDSEDIFSKGTRSQSTERTKAKVKATETSAHPAEGGKEKSPLFPALGEAGSDDDLFQSVKPRPAKKTNLFPLLDDEDDLFTDQKGKKNEPKFSDQQDVVSKVEDIFEDDIFATEAIKPLQKKREKEKNLEPSLLDDNIDIFADLTLKPKGKSKKKVEAKSIFDDDMDDIFSSGLQTKTTKPKSRPVQTAPEPRPERKVSNIFDDPLNAFGGQ